MTASFHSKNIGEPVRRRPCVIVLAVAGVCLLGWNVPAFAQAPNPPAPAAPPPVATPAPPAAPQPAMPAAAAAAAAPRPTDPAIPPGYLIGTDDVLSIVYWKDKDMSADAQVRPDGKIALPLLNDVQAAGLTVEQLREKLTEESKRFMEDANITVVVRQINSRRVFITGEVNKPGPYPLTSVTSVMQLIAMAGGLRDYANSKRIVVMRTVNGKPLSLPFNYKEVTAGKNLHQNIELLPGDTVVVP